MKTVRKISSLLLAAIMLLTLTVTAFAAGSNTVTVNGAKSGETYKLYKMLDLAVDDAHTAYSYTVVTEWDGFFKDTGAGAAYVNIDSQGYVTWKSEKKSDENMAEFGKAAAKFAADNSLTPETIKATSDKVQFTGLENGYYLVTSTLGTRVIVATTPDASNATINEKNAEPTVTKQVKEDSTNAWGETNTAQIGDTVEFKTVINAKSGAKGYVLHDKIEAGLTLNNDSVKVKVGESYLTVTTDYTVAFENRDSCAFEITFTQAYLDTLKADTEIEVYYTAVLNDKAEIHTKTNDNTTWLTYADSGKTAEDTTKTSTFEFDLVKTDSSKKVLNGAKFKLYDAQTGGTEIILVKEADGSYRVATKAEKDASDFTAAEIEAGKATIKGLDGDAQTIYWLEETEAPVGYNKLDARIQVKLENTNLTATVKDGTYQEGGVQVINNTGAELPSTGGIGRTVFYVAGAVLMLGAVILLVSKKRMSKYE